MKRKYERRQQRKRIIIGIVAGLLVLLLALGALAPLMRIHGAGAGFGENASGEMAAPLNRGG